MVHYLCSHEKQGNCHPINLSRAAMQEENMQDILTRRHRLLTTAMVVLLIIQAILGLFFSLSLITRLLAPGGPIIQGVASELADVIGGASLVVALASPIMAWGVWMAKPWARSRTGLLEIVSLVLRAFGLVFVLGQFDVIWRVCLALMGVAALILLCLYAGSRIHALSRDIQRY